MSPRALTAAAVLATVLAGPVGRAVGQFPPEAAPLGGSPSGLPAAPGGGLFLAGGQPPTMLPAMPPPTSPPAGPIADPGYSSGPVLATDNLGAAYGPKAWVGAEYLLYWTKHAPLSGPIATSGRAAGTGVLGAAGTQVILGNSDFDFKNFSGVRILAGYWLTNNESVGIESNFFILPRKQSGGPTVLGNGTLPVLARPFFNTATNAQSSRVLTRPGSFSGGINIAADQELWGAELAPVWRVRDNGRWTLDALAGFKYLNLNETLTVSDFATAQGGGANLFLGQASGAGSTTNVTDRIHTTNNFYGGVIGLRGGVHVEAFTLSLTGKLGLGNMEESVQADGTTRLIRPNFPPVTSPGGFFATGNSAGTFTRDEFVVIPELNLNLTAQVTSHIAVTFGYNYLAISDVVRPGDQLSTRINGRQLPVGTNFSTLAGPANAAVPLNTSTYWANGFNIGFLVGY